MALLQSHFNLLRNENSLQTLLERKMEEDIQKLIDELEKISPMPDDDDLTQEIVEQYEQIVFKLEKSDDQRIIKPLIYSFGFNDCFGVYQTVRSIVESFGISAYLPDLIEAAKRGQKGTRYWAANLLYRVDNPEAIPVLVDLLSDPEDTIRAKAVGYLGAKGNPDYLRFIKLLENDPSPEVRKEVKWAYHHLGIQD